MVLIANNPSSEILQPGKQSFDFPAAFVATKFSAILRCRLAAILFVRRDQFHATFFDQLFVQFVGVIRLVANHFFGQLGILA